MYIRDLDSRQTPNSEVFCFPSEMIHHNAPYFPDYKILGNFTEIKMLENYGVNCWTKCSSRPAA